ncbi:MAG: pseudouridine synthase [Chitinophagaceae bacterium]
MRKKTNPKEALFEDVKPKKSKKLLSVFSPKDISKKEKQLAAQAKQAAIEKRKNDKQANRKKKSLADEQIKVAPKNVFIPKPKTSTKEQTEEMPLNKFVAHSGICSRRDAVDLIKKGKIKVNGLVETIPGVKVTLNDYILFEDKRLFIQQKHVYYLLNKPKGYITTTEDPKGRKTVLDLLRPVAHLRIFPIGRLDRNTTGLLLLTNDGDLAQKLAHPKNNIKKVYQVVLDKIVTKKHMDEIAQGLLLEDGKATVDEVAYINPQNKKEIGIQIHIGRNRIVRRIFEHLGYQVKTLDRVIYAGLDKKNLPRGKWRELSNKEILYLKHY